MGDKSAIEWTDATWNPIVGCSITSPGCKHCYAMKQAARIQRMTPGSHYAGTTQDSKAGPVWTGKLALAPNHILNAPLRWKKPRRIFVNSMGDLFHEDCPDEWILDALTVMAIARHHTFQVLTKRADRMRDFMSNPDLLQEIMVNWWSFDGGMRGVDAWPLPNVWLGVSAEDQVRAVERIPHLIKTPAAVRFISDEPLLGPLDLFNLDEGVLRGLGVVESGGVTTGTADNPPEGYDDSYPGIDWVIAGGESGPSARPMHPDWARSLRDQCELAGVPFFFKQWGEWLPWEPEHSPCWVAQNGRSEDGHRLFPTNFDEAPNWDDGLAYVGEGHSHAAFQRVGKKAAGRLLDGCEHNGMPA